METAGRSIVVTKNFAFTQQIEKFSWRVLRGAYESPKYYCEPTRCNWSLVIEPRRESFFLIPTDYIEISLKREDGENENQSVSVRLTIVDSFHTYPFYASKEIDFTPSCNKDIVLRVEKNNLFGDYFGLNKWRFVPNDILTVKCEITVYVNVEENCASEAAEIENKIEHFEKEGKFHYFGISLLRCMLRLLYLVSFVCIVLLVSAVVFVTIVFFVFTWKTMHDFLYINYHYSHQDAAGLSLFCVAFLMYFFIVTFVVSATKKIWWWMHGDRTFYKVKSEAIKKLK